MSHCTRCGTELPSGAAFRSNCGQKTEPAHEDAGERVLGTVLFSGYYKDICFTDRRIIQFEVMRDRWKFLMKAAKPIPLVVERGGDLKQVLPFLKTETPRQEISALQASFHGRLTTGHLKMVRRSGEEVELARIDADVDKKSFEDLVDLLNSIYPEVAKRIK